VAKKRPKPAQSPIVYLGVGIYYERADGARNFLVGSSMSRGPQGPSIDLDEVQRNATRHVHGLIEEAKLLAKAEAGKPNETGKVNQISAVLSGRPTWPPPEPTRVDFALNDDDTPVNS
jgi:hypothetical protein